jgi:hypothetical protein
MGMLSAAIRFQSGVNTPFLRPQPQQGRPNPGAKAARHPADAHIKYLKGIVYIYLATK